MASFMEVLRKQADQVSVNVRCYRATVGWADTDGTGGIIQTTCKRLTCPECGPGILTLTLHVLKESIAFMTITDELVRLPQSATWSQFPIEDARLYLTDEPMNDSSVPVDWLTVETTLKRDWLGGQAARRATFSQSINEVRVELLADNSLLSKKKVRVELSATREVYTFEKVPTREDILRVCAEMGVNVEQGLVEDGRIFRLEGPNLDDLMWRLGGFPPSMLRTPETVPLMDQAMPVPF